MADRENVIKEWEAVLSRDPLDAPWDLIDDTLALLKEQGVKHGEWISIWEKDDPDTSTQARCSVCNRVSNRPAGEYCKWRGAKMDLEGR